jgi:predicted lactoylglutathione lyase
MDGPFPEAKEVLGGYWMIRVKSREEAIEWAKRCPASENETIEIRQVAGARGLSRRRAGRRRPLPRPAAEVVAGMRGREIVRANGVSLCAQRFGDAHAPAILLIHGAAASMDAWDTEFFGKLGCTFDPRFTDETATCTNIGENIFAMLVSEPRFRDFTPKPIADAKRSTEVLVALSCESRADVDRVVEAAFAAGARRYRDPKDHGFMYEWGFEDLDGQIWELLWMDPAALAAAR